MTTSASRVAARRPPGGLATLIDPMSVAEFLGEHWEQKPLVLHRDDPGFYSALLSFDDMDLILSTSRLRDSEIRVVSANHETPVADLVGDLPGNGQGLEAMYDCYRKGATINVNYVHQTWAPLTRLTRSLSTELSAYIGVNSYLTPPDKAQGLKAHYDTHDVFVAQIHGSKHWCLYASPMELPLETQPFRMPEGGVGEPVREFDLKAGDLLYLPRGTVHAAKSNDSASLHLTIGATPLLWESVIRDAVDSAVKSDARYRRGLPAGFATDPELRAAATTRVAELLVELCAGADAGALIADAAEQALLERSPTLRGHLSDLEDVRSLDADTPVHPRADLIWTIAHEDDRVRVGFHGKTMRLPARVLPALKFAAGSDTFTAHDLPGPLNMAGRLTLIGALVREGFLTLQPAEAS